MAYVTILESEFDAIFRPERNWVKEINDHTKEIVYTKRFISKPNVVIKVYSSISKNDGISRKWGADSIKVCAVNTKTNKGIVKSNRINRVAGWDARLKDKVLKVWNQVLAM